jgi:hypothetical protein
MSDFLGRRERCLHGFKLVLRKLWLRPSLESELSQARARARLVISVSTTLATESAELVQSWLQFVFQLKYLLF